MPPLSSPQSPTTTPQSSSSEILNMKSGHKTTASTMSPYGSRGVPEDKVQYLVKTPYGKGLVVRTRTHPNNNEKGRHNKRETNAEIKMREIELLDWKAADENNKENRYLTGHSRRSNSRPSTLFSCQDYASVDPVVGSDVVCQFGRGRVIEVRSGPHQVVVVQLSSWRLAGRSTITCYLARNAVQVVRKQHLYEMSVFERVEYAAELKTEAAAAFRTKDYATARVTYARAIEAVKYVQHSKQSSNEVRADLLTVLITCSNNAATCSSQLGNWDDALNYARNAVALLDALEAKVGASKIHKIMNCDGYSDVKLFGEWRVKSYLVQAKSLAEINETAQAIEILKKAHQVIAKYADKKYANDPKLKSSVKNLLSQSKEVKTLHLTCKERRKVEKKREKQQAQAMFSPSSSSPSPPVAVADSLAEEKKKRPVSTDVVENTEPLLNGLLAPKTDPFATKETNGISGNSANKKKNVTFAKDTTVDKCKDPANHRRLEEEDDEEWSQEEIYGLAGALLVGVAATATACLLLAGRGRR